MKQNKRFILLVVMVLLANCLFAGLASAATGPIAQIVVMSENPSKVSPQSASELVYAVGTDKLNSDGTLVSEQNGTIVFTTAATYTAKASKMTGAPQVEVFAELSTGNHYGFKVETSDPAVVRINNGKVDGTVVQIPATETTATFTLYKTGSSTITITAYASQSDYDKKYNGGTGASVSFTLKVAKAAPSAIVVKAGKEKYTVGKSLSAGLLSGNDIYATITKGTNSEDFIAWKSSDSTIALFDNQFEQYAATTTTPYEEKAVGHFSLLKPGTVTLTAYSKVDEKVLDSVKITVEEASTAPIKAVKFSPASFDYATTAGGSGFDLTKYRSFDPSTNIGVAKEVWESSDESILKVDEKGNVKTPGTGINGKVTITNTVTDKAGNVVKGSVEVTVGGEVSKLNKLTLDKNTATIYYKNADEKAGTYLKATTSQTTISDNSIKVTWATSDASVAILAETSSKDEIYVSPVNTGKCTITCTATDGTNTVSDKCEILVQGEGATAEGKIVLPKTSGTIRMIKGKTKTLKINAVGTDLTYTVDNEKIATVDAKGVVTAVGPGTAKITIKDKAGNFRVFSCVVKQVPVKKLVVENKSFSLKVSKSKKIGVTALPEYAYDKTVTYTSSDEKVATVDAKGKVTAVGKGKVKITVAAGEKTKTVTVTVK
jgi:uncharacterized protein YjdB